MRERRRPRGGGSLLKIWIKRAHGGPMDPVESAELIVGQGIRQNADQGGRRHVTLISREQWDQIDKALGTAVDPALRRANLLVSGIDFNGTRGKTLAIGSCQVLIHGETRPCNLMDESHPGLGAALSAPWAGGAFGTIVAGGVIRIGDSIEWAENP